MAERMWSDAELRNLIQMEVSTGTTMRILSAAISSGELTAGVQSIVTAANAQVNHLTAQAQTNADEINRVLADCRTFVEQSRVESDAAKEKLTQEVDALQIRFRDVVGFVEGVPDKVAALDAKLETITTWLAQNQLADFSVKLTSQPYGPSTTRCRRTPTGASEN